MQSRPVETYKDLEQACRNLDQVNRDLHNHIAGLQRPEEKTSRDLKQAYRDLHLR